MYEQEIKKENTSHLLMLKVADIRELVSQVDLNRKTKVLRTQDPIN